MRGSEEDWWFKFQNEKPVGLQGPLRGENRAEDQSKRTLVKRFLHTLMYKVKEHVEPPRNFSLNTLKESISTAGTMLRHSDQTLQISRSQFTKSLRSCASSARYSLWERPPTTTCKRIVCLSGLMVHSSMASTVGLVCGGGLEKIVYHDGRSPVVEVHFLSPDSANKFYEYSQKSLFLAINGYPLTVEWARPKSGTKGHPLLAPYVAEEVDGYRASRVIVLSRPVAKKLIATLATRGYPDPRENYSADLNIEKVKWDFVQFGGIVEVTPMVLSKLSFSIQYTDIRSAILAMHTLGQKSSLLYSKYSQWLAKYARDVTNRPCLAV